MVSKWSADVTRAGGHTAFDHHVDGVLARLAINDYLQCEYDIVPCDLGLQLSKCLSSLVRLANIGSKVIESANGSFLGLDVETEFICRLTKLRLEFTDVGPEYDRANNEVDDVADAA